MIYCVRFADVEAYLTRTGFAFIRQTGRNRYYAAGQRIFTIRAANLNGDLPEMIVDDAFDAAGMPRPDLTVFWCD